MLCCPSNEIGVTHSTRYPINEIFQTVQGEGYFVGVPSIFIRLQGCRVGCSWCDTKHTWHLDIRQFTQPASVFSAKKNLQSWTLLTADDICREIKQRDYSARHVVITGGEPCQYELMPLTQRLLRDDFDVQIETSGTMAFNVDEKVWVTVSPKIKMTGQLSVQKSCLIRANEIKHPVGTRKDIEYLDELLEGVDLSNKKMLLQPLSMRPAATNMAIEICQQRNWRLSIQTHKYIDIR